MGPQTAAQPGMMHVESYPPPDAPKPATIIAAKTNPSDTSVFGCILCAMSLFHPPEGFPPHLVIFWPLVWFQLRLLGAAVRAAYGKDTTYRWSITPNGRVFLTCIHFRPEDKAAREWLIPRKHLNDRLAAACDGRAAAPGYTTQFSEPRDAGVAPAIRRIAPACAINFPLPET